MEINEQGSHAEKDDSINLFDYVIVLAKRKYLILGITLSVAVITTISTLFIPNTYWGRTTVLLPQSSTGPVWARVLSEYTGLSSMGDAGLNDPNLFIQLLYSGPVLDKIIDKFGLAEQYDDAETKKELRDMLGGYVTAEFVLPDTGGSFGPATSRLLMISAIDIDPAKAADMANAFVEALQSFLKDIAVTQASQKRLFLEDQIKKVKEDLLNSENAMREFQEKTGLLKVDTQAQAILESIADLRSQIAAQEVRLSVMKSYSTANNPDLQKVDETIKGLKKELAKLEQKDGNNPDLLLSSGMLPSVGTDYVRKLRDLKFNETLYELMMKQYELARIEEAQDPAIIQVLEKAFPSEERAGPERKKKIIKTSAVSFIFSIILVFLMEFIEKYKSVSPENRKQIETLKEYLSFRKKR